MKVLAIGAHPDDIEIFMLGFLLACKHRKDEIHLAIATDGAAGNLLELSGLVKIRKEETIKALDPVGIPFFFDFPDGNLFSVPNCVKFIKNHIQTIKPDLIITHSPEDYHPDHRALSQFVHQAAGFYCPILYSDTLMGVNFNPDYYVDITPFFDMKCEAILRHESQNPKKFLEATELLNRFRSAQCNCPKGHYAEAYRMDKSFPFSDIRDMLPPSPGINSFYRSLSQSLI